MKNVQKILNAILSKNVFEYLLVDRNFHVTQFSWEVLPFLETVEQSSIAGRSLFDLLPELVGSEETLQEVLKGRRNTYAITTVAKKDRYFNIYVDHFDEENLLILLQDITEITRVRQQVLQYSNQTALLAETLKKIIDSQNSLIFLANARNRIKFANTKFMEYFRIDPEQFKEKELTISRQIGSGFVDFEELHRAVSRGLKEIRIGEDVFSVESIRIDPANTLFTFSKITELFRKKQRLKEELDYDGLTRVFRKQVFDERLGELLQGDDPFAVAVVDIDDFKQINDRSGHLTGDRVLQQFAEILRQEVGEGELVARWGGEEFLLLLRGEDAKELRRRMERLLEKIRTTRFDSIPFLTASIGLTQRGKQETPESILSRADKALYRAKGEGKNRVVYIPPHD